MELEKQRESELCSARCIGLNVIFLGIALYKMFHHTAILKPDSGCLDNIKLKECFGAKAGSWLPLNSAFHC
ncbi:hypothetical protein CRENBAI_008027 [Crenichthys baileyi]|uniref:Uncharacterized protein n=1 Tax=Crenichthys baileyi TaxID=28760 RepID=A0AAV9R5W6_9TELE